METTWLSLFVLLLVSVNVEGSEDARQPCAQIRISDSVVPLGSPVRATCVISQTCLKIAGDSVAIEWRLGNRVVPSSASVTGTHEVSEVVIQSFNHTRAFLTCCVRTPSLQVLGGVEIKAGYPPEPAQNLSCQTNLTNPNTLHCRWDPGPQNTNLPLQYTIHNHISETNESHTYKIPPGVHSFTIPRPGFNLFVDNQIYVKAANDLGEAASVPIIIEPVSVAKFDQPKILAVESVRGRPGCLRLIWALSQEQNWMKKDRFNVEVQLKPSDSRQWGDQPTRQILVNWVLPTRPLEQCRLQPGTPYLAQIRVRFRQSPWSEWSSSRRGVTLESAPSGRLHYWMKLSEDPMHKQVNIHLYWKPSQQFRANSQNVSYVVSVQKGRGRLCSTVERYCSFQRPGRVQRVYLTAVNAAGESSPTEVRIYRTIAVTLISDVSAVPRDDGAFVVRWKNLDKWIPNGYVVEWKPLLQTDLSLTRFEIADRNQSSLVITGSFEPYKPYGISVYPRFKDGMGLPQTVNAYSRQKAPSMVPKIQIKTWSSGVELTWDEIPQEQRHGIIKSYKVFYWAGKGPIHVVSAEPQDRKVVLRDLDSVSVYEAFMMVSTLGGSINGSTFHFEVGSFDAVTIATIVIVSTVGFLLFIIFAVVISLCNHKRLKGRLWPLVPDPANSSIKRWTSESSQSIHLPWDSDEPTPVYLTHLSFLDLPLKLSKEEDDRWLKSTEDTSDLGESICGSPLIPGYSGSSSDSVPYATVIFSEPCSIPPPKETHVYLRSESTQPLLESEETDSPKCYQNIGRDGRQREEQCFFGPSHDCVVEEEMDPVIVWDDFPFLRAMNDMQYE